MKLAEINIKDVHPSTSNTRADYNGTDMAELIKSIESVGLLNPIIVRKAGDMGYEIVAGHRRYHAMKKLGKESLPVQIVEATEEDAAQIRLIENLHRKDLNPIEEAQAFQQLFDKHQLTTEAIAQRADKSVAYVARALALLGLPKKAVEAIRLGTMPAAHGHQIARAPEKERVKLAEFAVTVNSWTKRVPTMDELKREIEKKIEKDLKTAPFPKDVDKYGGTDNPACNVCPYNTGNQNVLFDGAVAGKCTNPSCFTKRTAAGYKDLSIRFQADNPKLTYLGVSASPGYMEFRELKGYPVVDFAKRAKAIRANPEKYGFVIVKPNAYDKKSKVAFHIVSLDKKEKPEPREDRDWEKERFVNEKVLMALRVLAHNSVDKLEKKHVIQMLDSDGNTDMKALGKMSMDDLLVRLWIASLGSYEVPEKLKAVGIDARATVKEVTQKAEADYAEAKTKKEKSE